MCIALLLVYGIVVDGSEDFSGFVVTVIEPDSESPSSSLSPSLSLPLEEVQSSGSSVLDCGGDVEDSVTFEVVVDGCMVGTALASFVFRLLVGLGADIAGGLVRALSSRLMARDAVVLCRVKFSIFEAV